MKTDPRKARTLGEAAANGDGTYNGARAMAWLSEALHPGSGLTEQEVKNMWDKVQRERAIRSQGQ
jgi:hypothetical protein